ARFRAAPNHLAGDSGPSELGYSQTAPRCLPRGRPRSRPAQPTPMRSRSPSLGVYVNFVPCCRGATLTFSLLGYKLGNGVRTSAAPFRDTAMGQPAIFVGRLYPYSLLDH